MLLAEHPAPLQQQTQVRLSEVISAMSYALDICEGQPEGHAIRSCLIGMRLADMINLPLRERSALYYALLLKDLGCSSNAAKVCSLFMADDRQVKHDIKTVNWRSQFAGILFSARHVIPTGSAFQKVMTLLGLSKRKHETSRDLFKTRCERGASIASSMGFPEATGRAILDLDEHWDGGGHPLGLSGHAISLCGRICCLAQTVEVFYSAHGYQAAVDVALARSGKWFDPSLVRAVRKLKPNDEVWRQLAGRNLHATVAAAEPHQTVIHGDDATIDRIAEGFAAVVDAKSPWTFRHSRGVSDISVAIGVQQGLTAAELREIRLGGLLHDIGKLGVSNLVLDKPAKLTDEEFGQMKSHTQHTQRILERVSCFRSLADFASAHHERMDGRGYHRGLSGANVPWQARIMAVADVAEALTADRPYRAGMPTERVLDILKKDRGTAFCPDAVDAFCEVVEQRGSIDALRDHSGPACDC